MRRCLHHAMASFLALLLLAACGSEDTGAADKNKPSPSGSSASTASTTESEPADTKELPAQSAVNDAMLRLSDLPKGFSVDADAESEIPDSELATSTNDTCSQMLQVMEDTGPLDEAPRTGNVDYEASEFGPYVEHMIGIWESGDEAAGAMKDSRQFVDSCQSWNETAKDGTKSSFAASALRFPEMGDETIALTIKADISGKGFELSLAVAAALVRVGNGITLVDVTSVKTYGGDSAGLDLEALTRTAVERLSEVI